MEFDPVAAQSELEQIVHEAQKFYEQVRGHRLDWESLKWSVNGPAGMFEQFRLAGGWHDYITSQVQEFEHRRNVAVSHWSPFKIQVEKDLGEKQYAQVKKFVDQKFAYQERHLFARIEVGDRAWNLTVFENLMSQIESALDLLKAKAKMFADFKNDVRVAVQIMNFGNQLGELR